MFASSLYRENKAAKRLIDKGYVRIADEGGSG